MQTLYACTFIEKEAEVDSWETGCDPSTRTCVMNERVNIAAPTLALLIQSIGNYLGLEIDDVWVPEQESGHIGFNRLEDAEGNEPSERLKEAWKADKAKLYLADYHFAIEKRQVSTVDRAEFDQFSVKHHE
jgi:hypothetical protein